MTTSAIKKQVDNYLPLLPKGQQSLVLEVIKSLFEEVNSSDRIDKNQYNKEIDEAVARNPPDRVNCDVVADIPAAG